MRPLKTQKIKNRRSNKKIRTSNKKVWNIFKNQEFLTELWQLLFFSSTSILLIFTYLNQAWEPIKTDQLEIIGLSGITKIDVEKAIGNFFPKNLLELSPKQIEAYLSKRLPIKKVSASRKFFPPGIKLNILERDPVAFATRVSLNKVENGLIDIDGYWIPLEFINESKQNKIKIFVENWSPNKRNDITLLIKNRFSLQSPLQKIILNPLQEIIIETEHFNSVLLGSNTDRLKEQINILNQLQESLPNLLINTKVKIVDLKDPSKPELKIEKILTDER